MEAEKQVRRVVTDEDGLDQRGSRTGSEKWLHMGYTLKG